MNAQALIAASAVITFSLGLAHLVLTYASNGFGPRDPALEQRLKEVSPKISRDTTMWDAATGFHASHSLGAMLFGAVYGYLTVWHFSFLLQSAFLSALGGLTLAAYLVLAKRYWFIVPLSGIALASACYALGMAVALA